MESESVFDQIVKSMAFEVEAVPQKFDVDIPSVSKTTPINLKIKVRNKSNTNINHGVLIVPKLGQQGRPKTVRLVNSDQTIISFNVFMDSDLGKKPLRKPRRKFFARCLGIEYDNDDPPYTANTAYQEKSADKLLNQLDEVLNCAIVKNNYADIDQSHKDKKFFGKCKPGGCLDPPFDEEKYSYMLAKPTRENVSALSKLCAQERQMYEIKNLKSDERQQSATDRLTKKIRKSKNVSSIVEACEEDVTSSSSILSLYHAEFLSGLLYPKNSKRKDSDSIITYPPTLSPFEMCAEKNIITKNRVPSDDKSRKSNYETFSNTYFIPPKNINRRKENFTTNSHLNQIQSGNNITEELKNNAASLQFRQHSEEQNCVNQITSDKKKIEQKPKKIDKANENIDQNLSNKDPPKLSPKIESGLRCTENNSVKEIHRFVKDMNENEIKDKYSLECVFPSSIENTTIEKTIESGNSTDKSDSDKSIYYYYNVNMLNDSDITDINYSIKLGSEIMKEIEKNKSGKEEYKIDSKNNLELQQPNLDKRTVITNSEFSIVDDKTGSETTDNRFNHTKNLEHTLEDYSNLEFLRDSGISEKHHPVKPVLGCIQSTMISETSDKTERKENPISQQINLDRCRSITSNKEFKNRTFQTKPDVHQEHNDDNYKTEKLTESIVMDIQVPVNLDSGFVQQIISEKERDELMSKDDLELQQLGRDKNQKVSITHSGLINNSKIVKDINIVGLNTSKHDTQHAFSNCETREGSPDHLFILPDKNRISTSLDKIDFDNISRTLSIQNPSYINTQLLVSKHNVTDDQAESFYGNNIEKNINSLNSDDVHKQITSLFKKISSYDTKEEGIVRTEPEKENKIYGGNPWLSTFDDKSAIQESTNITNTRASYKNDRYNQEPDNDFIKTDLGSSQHFSKSIVNKKLSHDSGQYKDLVKCGTNKPKQGNDDDDESIRQENHAADINPKKHIIGEQYYASFTLLSETSNDNNNFTQVYDDIIFRPRNHDTYIKPDQDDPEPCSASHLISLEKSLIKDSLTNMNAINKKENLLEYVEKEDKMYKDKHQPSILSIKSDIQESINNTSSYISTLDNYINQNNLKTDKSAIKINLDVQHFSELKVNKKSIHNLDQDSDLFKNRTNRHRQIHDDESDCQKNYAEKIRNEEDDFIQVNNDKNSLPKNNTTDMNGILKNVPEQYSTSCSLSSKRSHDKGSRTKTSTFNKQEKFHESVEKEDKIYGGKHWSSTIGIKSTIQECTNNTSNCIPATDKTNETNLVTVDSIETGLDSQQFDELKVNKKLIHRSDQHSDSFEYSRKKPDHNVSNRQKNLAADTKSKRYIFREQYSLSSLSPKRRNDNDEFTQVHSDRKYRQKHHTANIKTRQYVPEHYLTSPERCDGEDGQTVINSFNKQENLCESVEKKESFVTRKCKSNIISKLRDVENNTFQKFIDVDFAFQSYLNDENGITLKTVDSFKESQRRPKDSNISIKTQIAQSHKIQIPINNEKYMEFRIMSHDALGKDSKLRTNVANLSSDAAADTKKNDAKEHLHLCTISDAEAFQVALTLIYEQQLVPLQSVIKDLKQQVALLANQQLWMKDNLYKAKKTKQLRFTHSKKKCVCSRT